METPDLQKDRVLVVEDEVDLAQSLSYALRASGYDTEVAGRGELALRSLETFVPDLVLLDLMLPDMSGLEICRTVRSGARVDKPSIIILSARTQEIDRVVGFEVGADDYVTKPFSVRELMLRIEVRLKVRRSALETTVAKQVEDKPGPAQSFVLRNLRVDEVSHRVHVDDAEVHVSALEMKVLVRLFQSPGRMLTRRALLTEVWGYHPDVASRTVDTHMKRLRDKLGRASDLLQTVRGVGFRLADPKLAPRHGD